MPNRLGMVLYNLDRTVASLIWATSQETISSEVGRIVRGEPQVGSPIKSKLGFWIARGLAKWLDENKKIWGVAHTAKAIEHADALDKVDDGKEQ